MCAATTQTYRMARSRLEVENAESCGVFDLTSLGAGDRMADCTGVSWIAGAEDQSTLSQSTMGEKDL